MDKIRFHVSLHIAIGEKAYGSIESCHEKVLIEPILLNDLMDFWTINPYRLD